MRTVDSVSFGSGELPPPGKYGFTVVEIEKGKSQVKKTPFVQPTLLTHNGDYQFVDQLYVVGKALSRLCLFARRICKMPDDFKIPDEDQPAAIEVAKYIMENARDKTGIVKVEENEEKFIPESGPDAGRTITRMRRRVAFIGYEKDEDLDTITEKHQTEDDDLPF